jgi:hypothetical protein
MMRKRQQILPGFRSVVYVEKKRKDPQPRPGDFRIIRQYEIFHRPFDLRFRGQINKWLTQIKLQKKIRLKEVLEYHQLRIVRLYFFPQKSDKKWMNQEEVLEKIGKTSKKKLKTQLVSALVRIWKADRTV